MLARTPRAVHRTMIRGVGREETLPRPSPPDSAGHAWHRSRWPGPWAAATIAGAPCGPYEPGLKDRDTRAEGRAPARSLHRLAVPDTRRRHAPPGRAAVARDVPRGAERGRRHAGTGGDDAPRAARGRLLRARVPPSDTAHPRPAGSGRGGARAAGRALLPVCARLQRPADGDLRGRLSPCRRPCAGGPLRPGFRPGPPALHAAVLGGRGSGRDDPRREETWWHNALFNPQLPPDIPVLAFAPRWLEATADPRPGPERGSDGNSIRRWPDRMPMSRTPSSTRAAQPVENPPPPVPRPRRRRGNADGDGRCLPVRPWGRRGPG